MTGTGTQNDPYIVDNWEDFMSKVSTDCYIKFPEGGGYINVGEIAPNGYDSITVKARVTGNGWEIHGLTFSEIGFDFPYNDTEKYLKNLRFTGMYVTSGSLIYTGINSVVNGCLFTGTLGTGAYLFRHYSVSSGFTNYYNTIRESTFEFVCSDTSRFLTVAFGTNDRNTLRFWDCIFKLRLPDNSQNMVTGDVQKIEFERCSFICENSGVWNFGGAGKMTDCTLKIASNYDMTLPAEGKIQNTIICADNAEIPTIPSGAKLVTLAQFTDEEYLQSIGFGIGV